MSARPLVRLLRIPSRHFRSVQAQLVFEEQLFRLTRENWCIFSRGKPKPTVVMGLSGKPDLLLDVDRCRQFEVAVVKRFSGGGTVVVDQDTLFVSWVCNKDVLPHTISNSPPALMQWSADFYAGALALAKAPIDPNIGTFGLREHDYCFGERKFGGNAQCLTRDRWVHHTSFLWNFHDKNMEFLTLPQKRPAYRKDRAHNDFLCRLGENVPGEGHQVFVNAVVDHATATFDTVWTDLAEALQMIEDCEDNSAAARRISTKIIEL